MKPRIILIRENPETLSCSDCAGSLEGIDAFGSHDVPDYESIRQVMGQVGEIYRNLRRQFGDAIRIDVVDPRNTVYLIPTLVGDFLRYRPPFGVFIKTVLCGISPTSVIFNGRALFFGKLPAPHHLVQWVGRALQGSEFNQP